MKRTDSLGGNLGADTLLGGPGDDEYRFTNGWGRDRNADDLMGMDGSDDLFGGSAKDTFDAGKGADVVRAVDGEADQILCGPGDDKAFRDPGLDTVQGCENLRR